MLTTDRLGTMIGKKILLIDDDTEFLQLASLIFKEAGAQVITATDGLEGISRMFTHRPDMIILDVMMPGMNGLQVCQRIRRFSNTPLIMLTALDRDQPILQGLDAGADDFLSKPLKPEILLARARAVLRRSEQGDGHHNAFPYGDGRLKIDAKKHRVLIEGRQIKLTPVEFRLLVYLANNAGKVLSFDQILVNVWGSEYSGNADYVHVYTSHLRRKIEQDAKSPRYIVSIHGVGYIFEKQDFAWASTGN